MVMGIKMIFRWVSLATVHTLLQSTTGACNGSSEWGADPFLQTEMQRLFVPCPVEFGFECVCTEGALEGPVQVDQCIVCAWLSSTSTIFVDSTTTGVV